MSSVSLHVCGVHGRGQSQTRTPHRPRGRDGRRVTVRRSTAESRRERAARGLRRGVVVLRNDDVFALVDVQPKLDFAPEPDGN